MALPESVISGGTNVGTSGNDDLSTSEYDIMTAITTIYSALNGLGGDDILNNNGQVENVTLDGGADNDRIYNTLSGGGQSPSIVGGDGDDVIENGYATDQLKANNATIDAGAGSDTVDNYGDNALITLGDGDNSLYHVGDKATITSGNGADNISVYGDDVSISTGAGDDYVGGSGSNVTVSGGAGNDLFIYSGDNSYATNVLLDDTIGTNYFRISNSNNSTINAGNGADSVASSHNQKTLINIGAGNNSVTSEYDSEISIQAQGGNDTINIYDGNKILIAAGDGANYIEIHNVNDSTSAGFTINAGAGADSIINRANDVLISAGDGNNSISNGAYGGDSGDNVTINTGSGNDFINNYYDSSRARGARQENVIINAGAGNDTVTNSTDKVTIDGGAGKDELSSYDSSDVSINGGAGADTIFIANGTVSGGAGDDSLSAGDNVLIQYNSGDGNDAVWSFDENSTLSIGGGNYSSVISGSDVILTVGESKITLSGAAELQTLNIIGNGSNEIPNSEDGVVVTGTDAAEQFENKGYNVTINALGGNDTINNYGNHVSINGGTGDDLINTDLDPNADDDVTVHYAAGDGNDSISGHMSDDGATNYKLQITGAPYSSAISGEDVVLTVGTDSILLYNAASSAEMGGLDIDGTLAGGDSDVIENTVNNTLVTGTNNADTITNSADNVTIQALGGNDSIFGATRGNSNIIIDAGDGNDVIETYGSNISVNAGNGNDSIHIFHNVYATVLAGAGNDTIFNTATDAVLDGGEGNDFIHNDLENVTITGGADDDIIENYGDNVVFNYSAGDGNDIIMGFDANDTLSISGGNYSSVISGSNVIIGVGTDSITLDGAASLSALNIVGTLGGDGDTTLADTIKAAVVADMILHRTEAGYPVIAGMAFHPEEYHGGEPTNYVSKETWSITSTDGLELEGYHYTPENSNDKWVIIIHGYGHNHKHMYPFAGFYLDNGYNVLMVDQRAAGESEGEWLTMGAAESQDIALWTQEIARRNSNAKITLFGVSMGSATAMLAAARSDITNVTSLVEDCGYTNMMDVVRLLHSNIPAMQSLLSAQDLPILDTVASVFTGYNLSDAAPLDSISAAKMPSLFITGTEDAVVPVSALTALYDASGADVKEKFIVDGATHGVAGLYDPVGYSNTVFRFLAEANEEGWVTENIYDDIFLRGTKYADSITNSGDNVTISTGDGNDTITNSGDNVSIDAGAGNNLIRSTGSSQVIVFNGQTTVEGFNLGFGDGTDTLYIPGNPAGVDFRAGILTFYDDSNAVVLSDVTSTAKVNLYHESRQMLNKGVFIADNDWYSVERGDLSVKSGEEVYFVGPSATPNHGVDFSGISSNLNLTLDTAYIDSEDYVPGTTTWINGVYSIRGGAGLTTITGSKLSDTIFAGTGATTINARGGNDYISLQSARALVEYAAGDGNDVITGFNANSTLNLSGEEYSSVASGNDVVLTVGDEEITLAGAATLDNLNIVGSLISDVITNTVDHTLVTGTAYNDTIINYGKRVTVRGLAGDDYLVNMIDSSVTAESAVANLFEGGDGNDTIFSYHSYHPTLLGGDGNDRIIVNKGHMNYIDGGNGNDTILGVTTDTQDSSDWAMGGYATILGGAGNDYINPFYTNNSTISGGAGNDTIIMMGADSTINGGTGDDQISLGTADSVNVMINYAGGDGRDLITGFGENDTLNISGAQYASITNRNDLILMVGDGRLTLKGAVNLDTVNIIGSYDEASDSIISNSDNRVSVAGTSANDTIVNTGRYDTIQGLAGNDSIDNSGENGLIFGDEGNDIIRNSGSNVYIYGNAGNDSIYSSGTNNTIFGGDGSNRVSLSGSNASFVVLEGKTTVDGFTTGFGSGADTVYVTGDPAVDFKSGGLTFYEESNGDSLTLNNVTDTEKVYLYYTETNRTQKGIFIAKNDMYTVTDSDFSLRSNEGLYFVGTSATNNHGVDFSSITQAINVTLNTDYNASPQFWVNNVHSIIGGAGRTQITGSDEDDTIIAYTGATTINAGDGNDHIILSTAQARVNYEAGDGNDLIQGFSANSTLSISGAQYSSVISGSNVVLTVGTGTLTLQGAADLDELNIIGTEESPDDYNGGDKTISDYEGQPITFNDAFFTSAFNNGNFLVQSSTGTLIVENVVDKIIDLRDGDGNVFVKAYTPSQAGVIDGRGISGIEIIEGNASGTDVIFAGDGGSSLWGGGGLIADALVGGNGVDIFVSGRGQGNDNIFAASSTDMVNLTDASLSDVVGTLDTGTGVAIGFNTGAVINVQSTDTLSAAINLADGSSWRFNHTTKTWQNA